MLLLLLLVVAVFCVLLFRLVSCVTCSFFCAVFLFWPPIDRNPVTFILFTAFLLCLSVFLLVCCASFWFDVFLLLPSVTNIVAQGPVSTQPHAFFACPPILNWPTQLIPTIHGHICTSSLVCVLVACEHVYFWSCAHVVRSCACVCVPTCMVNKCVF